MLGLGGFLAKKKFYDRKNRKAPTRAVEIPRNKIGQLCSFCRSSSSVFLP